MIKKNKKQKTTVCDSDIYGGERRKTCHKNKSIKLEMKKEKLQQTLQKYKAS